MVESREEQTEKKINELALRLGMVMGALGREDIEKYFDDYGFSYEKQKKLKELLIDMAEVFYKDR